MWLLSLRYHSDSPPTDQRDNYTIANYGRTGSTRFALKLYQVMTTKQKIDAIRDVFAFGLHALEEYYVEPRYTDEEWGEICEFFEEMIYSAK